MIATPAHQNLDAPSLPPAHHNMEEIHIQIRMLHRWVSHASHVLVMWLYVSGLASNCVYITSYEHCHVRNTVLKRYYFDTHSEADCTRNNIVIIFEPVIQHQPQRQLFLRRGGCFSVSTTQEEENKFRYWLETLLSAAFPSIIDQFSLSCASHRVIHLWLNLDSVSLPV